MHQPFSRQATCWTDGVNYMMQMPGDAGVVLPGYYLLFTMTADGTPSVARFIHIA